ncbi:MAG: cyclic nucleotide-binding domain-containing protein [Hyphomicrobiales bacterium]|nr:MAG: cyclic nucleotide-binding domain-containing protein [Hyphomicrobiales bacterium]
MELTLESAFSLGGLVGHLTYILLVVSMLMRRMVLLRLFVILSALFAITYDAVWLNDPVGVFWDTLLVVVNVVQLLITWHKNRSARFSDEEGAFMATRFPDLRPADRRRLLDAGVWLHADEGTVLTREGAPVEHLAYLADGRATVLAGEVPVATCEPGSLIGEITVLEGTPANATVIVSKPARFWMIEAQHLRDMVANRPEIGRVIENSIARAIGDKLVRSNASLKENGSRA